MSAGTQRGMSKYPVRPPCGRNASPEPPRRVGPPAVAARYEVAHGAAAIGGDLFSVHRTPCGVRILLADVRGTGLQTVRTVNALLGAAFRQASDPQPDLPGVVQQLENRMRGGGRRGGRGGSRAVRHGRRRGAFPRSR